jgi:acyl transferase domain-containing protein
MSRAEEYGLTDDLVEGRDIAIIGMAGRFPQSKDLNAYWQNLKNGMEGVTFFSDEELVSIGMEPNLLKDPNYVKAGTILEDVEYFDASFFGYNPREAETMDPQQRLFLEHAWEALENAGYVPGTYDQLIGVYAGVAWNTYLLSNLATNRNLFDAASIFQVFITNDKDFMPTRVSYKLNLKGPSVIIQTSCSTSLVAVHLACLSLLNYECDMALVGGVTVKVPQKAGYYYVEGGLASPDGHCRTFDAKGQGTIFGSGVGIVVLKRLAEALEDRDHIYAVIKGSAINNDGSLKVSYTAPSVEGQAEVIAAAQAVAGIDPETIGYIEAHGTATSLGDPIEVAALTKVFRASTQKKGFCAIGSVKSNIGHLDAAAGAAGLIKTVLALQHKMIPPSLHFEEPNPAIDFESSPFYVNVALREWSSDDSPRRAGVSSFGVGGTNAHVILEEAPVIKPSDESRPWQLLLLSARTDTALETTTENLVDYLEEHSDLNLADVAYTLQMGRAVFRHRRMLVCQSCENKDAVTALATLDPSRVFTDTDTQEPRNRPVVFMFTGQGAQYVNMARDLYQFEPIFQEQVDRCSELLRPHLGLDLREVLYPWGDSEQALDREGIEAAIQRLSQTEIAQPALFVIEYALAKLWMEWGVHPQAMIGHSIGEYVAACLAGVFSLEDGLALVAARGRLMQQVPAGAMLAVSLPEQEVQPLLGPLLSLAAVNGPTTCVVSGPTDTVNGLERRLAEEGVPCRRLHTWHAFHSTMMDPILEPFMEQIEKVTLNPPQIPYVSNITGTWVSPTEVTDPHYWANHLRQTVRFADGLGELLRDSDWVLLEVGPGRTLSTLARQHPGKDVQQVVLSSLCHPKDNQSDVAFLLNTLGKLWLAGVAIDWSGFYSSERRRRVPLPTYPFERQRYWIERADPGETPKSRQAISGKQPDLVNWFYLPSWKRALLSQSQKPGTQAQDLRHWLIFLETCGVGAEIAQQLKQAGQKITQVRAGEQFGCIEADIYTLNPRQPADYHDLFQELCKRDELPQIIVHLWSMPSPLPGPSCTDFDAAQHLGYYSLLFLAQALEKHARATPVQINVISNHMQQVAGEEVLYPEKATLLGLCKVIPQEYLNVTCRSLDIDLSPSEAPGKKLIHQLVAEMRASVSDGIVAYRNQQRWVQTFEPVRVEGETTCFSPLRENGVYLITDGLNGIGFILARYLAQTVKAKLILIEASFPQRECWKEWLTTHSDRDEVSSKIQKAQTLETLGAEVLVLCAKVADAGQLRAAIAQGIDRFGSLHGVIHAEGVVGERSFRSVQETGYEESEWHFGPKARGGIALDKVLRDQTLDFCLLVSSLSSVLGGRGYAAYAAANLFLDAFAHKCNQDHAFPWISVNWDAWQLEEEEETITALSPELARFAMSPSEVGETLQRALTLRTTAQIVVSTGSLSARLDQWIRHLEAARDQVRYQHTTASVSLHPRPNLQTPYTAPGTDLERAIVKIWQDVLGFEQIGVHDNFFELGGDSLIAMRVNTQLKEVLKMDLPVAKLYQGVTIETLAQLIEQEREQSGQSKAKQFKERKEKMTQRRQYQLTRRSDKQSRGDN